MTKLEIKASKASVLQVMGIIVAAVLIATTVILLLAGISRGVTLRRATIYTYLPDATGLTTQSEVRLSGLSVGKVSKVELSGLLDAQRAVRVDLNIGAEYLHLVPVDSVTSISTDTLVGPAFVSIAEGKSTRILKTRGTLPSEPLQQAQERADQVQAVRERLTQVDRLVRELSTPETRLGRFLLGDAEYASVLSQVSGFEHTVRELVSPTNEIGQALFSDQLFNKVRQPLMKVDETLAAIQKGEGAAGRLFTSDAQYNNFVAQARQLNKVLADIDAGKGPAGKMLRDDAAHARILAMVRSTNSLLDTLTKGEGSTAQLLRDPRLYESLNGSLKELTAFLQDFRDNPKKYLRVKLF
ncbi:MAG: Mammalian cell entry related domain protein [Bryobacterales bacterium]|nr:Mammalian cell entry related domain protein [Bryobacterales bacterium]